MIRTTKIGYFRVYTDIQEVVILELIQLPCWFLPLPQDEIIKQYKANLAFLARA